MTDAERNACFFQKGKQRYKPVVLRAGKRVGRFGNRKVRKDSVKNQRVAEFPVCIVNLQAGSVRVLFVLQIETKT